MKRKISCIVMFSLFIVFLLLYLTNRINFFDEYVYSFINIFRSENMTTFMKNITFFASTKFVIFLMLVFLLIYFIKKKKIYLIIDMIIIGEVIINNVIKLIVGRERPELVHLVTETSYSFPSGHAMAATVLYGLFIYMINKSNMNKYLKIFISILLIILVMLIMISRIYLNVHYASDVFAGMCLSLSYLIYMITLLEKRKKI